VRQLLIMTRYDLLQRIRDKSVLIFAILVPLALMFVINLVMGDMTNPSLKPTTVAASVPADDAMGQTLVGALKNLKSEGVLDVTVRPAAADQVHALTKADTAQVGLIVPDGFTAAVQQGRAEDVTIVSGNGSGIERSIIESVIRSTVDRFAAAAQAAAAGSAAGVPHAELAAIGQQVATSQSTVALERGTAPVEQLSSSGALVAGQAGLFLLFTVGFGVTALVSEREGGTLARLKSMPMPPWTIIAGKALVSFVLGAVATTVLLVVGGRMFDISFGSPVAVAALVLAAVTAATSLMFIIARIARTAEQANIAQSIVAMVLGIAGGAFFQITASGWVGSLMDLNPVAAFIRGLGITSGGGGLGDIGTPALIMLGFAVVMIVLSRLIPDRGAAQ